MWKRQHVYSGFPGITFKQSIQLFAVHGLSDVAIFHRLKNVGVRLKTMGGIKVFADIAMQRVK